MWRTLATERLILPNGLSKPRETTETTETTESDDRETTERDDRNFISAMSGIRTHNVLIDSPACYH